MRVPYILARAIILLAEDVYRAHWGKDPYHAKEMRSIADELARYQYLDHPELLKQRESDGS